VDQAKTCLVTKHVLNVQSFSIQQFQNLLARRFLGAFLWRAQIMWTFPARSLALNRVHVSPVSRGHALLEGRQSLLAKAFRCRCFPILFRQLEVGGKGGLFATALQCHAKGRWYHGHLDDQSPHAAAGLGAGAGRWMIGVDQIRVKDQLFAIAKANGADGLLILVDLVRQRQLAIVLLGRLGQPFLLERGLVRSGYTQKGTVFRLLAVANQAYQAF